MGASLATMSLPSERNEIGYRGDARRTANKLLFTAAILLAASFLTGAWGIASLLHAGWLDTNDLPVGDNVFWGVVMLVLATVQGVSALLILFDRPSGRYLGILAAVIGLLSHVGAISAYPAWSLFAIALNAWIIYILAAYGRRPSR